MTTHTLLLTPWMAPHRIVPWQESIHMLYSGKIEVLSEYEEEVSSPSVTIKIPAVARLKNTELRHFKKGVKFSRINVMTRDNFVCQYCGTRKMMRDLNYDHVVPRRLGGKTVWDNIVTSCYPCNDRKGGRTPEQAGMKLLKRPARPKTLPMTAPLMNMTKVPDEWIDFWPETFALTGT
jgi:5-methylcytosine-specific restriction endonuclease McrA